MKANELRIGSRVNVDKIGNIVEVLSIWKQDYEIVCSVKYDDHDSKLIGGFKTVPVSDLTPIAITPEILLKCGFYKGEFQAGGYYGYSNGVLELDNDFNICLYDGRMDESETKIFVPETEYIHQLQNLYFALEGVELTVNL